LKTQTVLEELIDSVILKFKKRYPAQSVTLDIPDDIVLIPMDAILIEQVIINILENAVCHAVGFTEIKLRVSVNGTEALFEISDDGCGIDKDKLDGIFLGYSEKIEGKFDTNRRNFGIGLSVCATIVKAHGGSISAANSDIGGAVFRFSLPTDEETVNEQQ
jgi:two-component system sensor histidine kinase KdpD